MTFDAVSSVGPASTRRSVLARIAATFVLAMGIAFAATPAEACGNPDERACCAGEAPFGACVSTTVFVPQANSGVCGGFNPLGIQSSGVCRLKTPCGDLDQRACCLGEAGFGACMSPLSELPQPNSGYCSNASNGTQSNGVCKQITPCGGAGQRACCLSESANACQAGLAQRTQPNSGQCANAIPGTQSNGVCEAVTPCGGSGQRACCVGESANACQSGLVQISQPNAGYCGNGVLGAQSSSICGVITPCGAVGQRACCAGEAASACQSPLVQIPQPNSGQCANTLFGVQSSGICAVVTSCGGAGQRACCLSESPNACQAGLAQRTQPNSGQCANALPGTQSNGVCEAVTPCGGSGQRACCVGESANACQAGLVQISQPNAGYCGNGVLGAQSSSICGVITPCGAVGQRACCAGEAASACQSPLVQIPQPNSGQCANTLFGVQSSGICAVVTSCGGAGQRACCLSESPNACQAGLAQRTQPNSGQCANALPGIQSNGVCEAVTACGGSGQRACCVGESANACQAGLTELSQPDSGLCGNGVLGAQSDGVCGLITPCGGDGQRACCVGESPDACQSPLVQIPQPNSGQCANTLFGVQSDGICTSLTPCGDQGERACCAGETGFGACLGDLVELPAPNSGQCGNALPGVQSDGICGFISACGGEGERACCVGEEAGACDPGLAQIPYPNAGQCGNALTGIQSSGTCTPLSPCGGLGQRACCGREGRQPCDALLVEISGCSGDCSCGDGYAASSSCGLIDRIEEPTTGWIEPNESLPSPLYGYADLHLHLFANLAHGGGILAGAAFDPREGINGALRPDYGTDLDLVSSKDEDLGPPTCPFFLPLCGRFLFHGDHPQLGAGSDTVGAGTKDGGDRFLAGAESNFGAPLFNGWPTWNTTTHQQAYHVWLERAWRGGLRLTVMLAVTNQALCQTNKRLRGTDCPNGMASIDAQLVLAYDLENYIDAAAGGPGQGWFRIVRTPDEARSVISAGKLAVVLGIEMDNLFNCTFDELDPATGKCTAESVRANVDSYYAAGVRHIFPVHNFDNAFGSPATWQDAIHVGNRGIEGRWWDAEDCPGEDYGFKLNDGFGTTLFTLVMSMFGFDIAEVPAPHAGDASCNSRGLTPLGEILIDQLIANGMVIDVDHMSRRALDDMLTISESYDPPYPVVASHVQFFDLNVESIRHERMRTREQLERIRDVGGMIAAMLKDDVQDTDNIGRKFNVAYRSIPDDCRHSSKTWAQMFQYGVDVMGGPVAFGSDFNGVAGHVGPRFGSEGCGGDPGLGTGPEFAARVDERRAQLLARNQIQYPFTLPGFGTFERQVTGQKVFDFNVDGLAHVGLLPDLVADLREIGVEERDIDQLFGSAEAYVDLWDRAVAIPEPSAALGGAIALAMIAALRRRARRP